VEHAALDAARLVPPEHGGEGGDVRRNRGHAPPVLLSLVYPRDIVVGRRDHPQLDAEHQLAAQRGGPDELAASEARPHRDGHAASEERPRAVLDAAAEPEPPPDLDESHLSLLHTYCDKSKINSLPSDC
jgi:hypothetical protein